MLSQHKSKPITYTMRPGTGADDGGNLFTDIRNLFATSEEKKATELSDQSNPNTLLDEALGYMKLALYASVLYTIILNGYITYTKYEPTYGTIGAAAATLLLVVMLEIAKIKFGGMFCKSVAFGWLFRLRPQAAVYLIAGIIATATFWKSYQISTTGVEEYTARVTSSKMLAADSTATIVPGKTPRKDYDRNINNLLNERVTYNGQKLVREKSLATAKNLSSAAIEAEKNEGKRLDMANAALLDRRNEAKEVGADAGKSAKDWGGLAEMIQIALLFALAFCRRALVALQSFEQTTAKKNQPQTNIWFGVETKEKVNINGKPVDNNTPPPHRQIGFHRVDENGRIVAKTPTQTPVHPPLMTPLMPPVQGPTFDEVWNRLQGQKTDWLDANRDLARRVAERYQTIAKIADTYGIGRGQAAQMLPASLTINAIATEFNCSASQVNIVRRVVEHIELPDMGIVIEKGGEA